MLRAKGNEEFNKWWQYWMSTLAQNRVEHPTSGKKPDANVELTVDNEPRVAVKANSSTGLHSPEPNSVLRVRLRR
jgi:hypothetical protein